LDICKKKQKKIIKKSSEESEAGDFWGYTAIKRNSYFFSAFTLGKRTTKTCRKFIKQFSKVIKTPTVNEKLLIYTDGNFDYKTTIKEVFDTNTVDYGLLVKVKKAGIVIDKKKEVVFGSPELKDIETTNVENFNSILRGRLSRLVRKTNTHGKNKNKVNDSVELFKFYWNFIKPLRKGLTPRMMENLVNKIWNWEEFFYVKLHLLN